MTIILILFRSLVVSISSFLLPGKIAREGIDLFDLFLLDHLENSLHDELPVLLDFNEDLTISFVDGEAVLVFFETTLYSVDFLGPFGSEILFFSFIVGDVDPEDTLGILESSHRYIGVDFILILGEVDVEEGVEQIESV